MISFYDYTLFSLFAWVLYRITGNIDGELNLADWRFSKETAKLNPSIFLKSTIVMGDRK